MSSNPFGERRTRSKFTLPTMDFSFQDSPLKAAKSTLKQAGKNRKKSEEASSSSQPATTEPSHTQSNSDMQTADNDDTDDELLLSPGKRIEKSHASQSGANGTGSSIKRPSSRHDDYSSHLSPAEPQSPSTRRSKRARYALDALGETDKGKGKGPAHASSEPRPNTASRQKRKRTAAASTSKKPVSSATCAYEAPTIVLGKLRASSVPLFSASFDPAIPHVDLNNPPPSPQRARSRSASKERLPKLRITSNPFPVSQPRLEPIQDENLMDVDSLPPSHSEPIRLNLEEQEISSPLTEPLSPVPLPPATSSPDLEHDDETAVEGLPAVPAMSPLSPLTPAISSRSPSPCRLSPLPDEPQPIQESLLTQPTVDEDTPKPTVQERNGKTRLPRPTSTMNLAAKLKEVASGANAGKPSNLRVESSKGKGVAVTSKPSLPVNQPKPNAFDRLMAASQSANQPKAKPRPSQVASSSKVQKPKILFGSQTKPVLAEKPKVSMKSAMRKREKPKAAPKPPVLLLQPEDEEAPETAQRTPSPVVEETSEDVSNAPAPGAVEVVQEEPKQVPTPRLAGLFTPESTLSLSLFGTPPPEDTNDAEKEITPVVDANSTPNIDVVMTSPHKDVSSPAADMTASMSPLSSIDSPMLEPDMPLAPEPVAVEPIVPLDQETPTSEAVLNAVVEQAPIAGEPTVSQDQEIPTVSDVVVEQLPTTTDGEPTIPLDQEMPMPTTVPDAAVDPPPAAVEQTPPSPRKRKRGPAAQRAAPSTSRRVTRSVSQQSKPNPDAESDLQEDQQAAAPQQVVTSEAMEQSAPPEEPMVVSAPASPAKSVGGRRRSMSLKGGIASKIPVPVTPAKGGEPKSPTKPARSSPSKIARSTSLRLPRLSIHGASTLLALNDALDQLRMPPPPPPARPSTSMGFSRDLEDDDDDVPTKGKGKGKSTDDLDTVRDSMRRKSTVGSSALSNKGGITKAKPTSLTQKSMNNYFAPKPGSSSKPATATRLAFPRPGGTRIFGSRVAPRASKKTTLPSVMHSPVKGGGNGNNDDDNDAGDDIEVSQVTARGPDVGSSSDVFIAPSPLVSREDVDEEVPVVLSAGSKRSKKLDGWRDNARRASMAFDSLNESLNSPNVAPEASGSMGPPETPPSHRSSTSAKEANQSTSSVPDVTPPGRVTRSATAKTAPGALGKTKAGSSGHVSSKKKEVEAEAPTSLDVLDDCIVFVDVRTDEGEDAGGLFLEMLQKLGARTLTRVGSTCTHIIYKNGLNSTVSRWRKLNNKPAVVGITWVVDCAEQKTRVDETAYLIDLEGVNVAGVTKRRRSMLPKFLARELEDDSPYQDGREDDVTPNASSGSINFEDDLAPLEIIRRRTMGIVT
ncbi:hypothetical protein ONZ45_g8888 [Pleurotus djamor]|nr:hypothetical protein ONZ45_g8888 [Pleurotus djamor]